MVSFVTLLEARNAMSLSKDLELNHGLKVFWAGSVMNGDDKDEEESYSKKDGGEEEDQVPRGDPSTIMSRSRFRTEESAFEDVM